MIEVVPSLPAKNFNELQTKLALVRGSVSKFQIDVADGIFVPNCSWPMNPADEELFTQITKGEQQLPYADEFDFEVHFMAHKPEELLKDWMKVGIVRALFHVEARHDFPRIRALAKDTIELGISLKVDTPISYIDEYIEHISLVQIMGVANIGTQGQPFDLRAVEVVTQVKRKYPNVTIQVDGAVSDTTAPDLVLAGADRLAPGSFIFHAENPKKAIALLQNINGT